MRTTRIFAAILLLTTAAFHAHAQAGRDGGHDPQDPDPAAAETGLPSADARGRSPTGRGPREAVGAVPDPATEPESPPSGPLTPIIDRILADPGSQAIDREIVYLGRLNAVLGVSSNAFATSFAACERLAAGEPADEDRAAVDDATAEIAFAVLDIYWARPPAQLSETHATALEYLRHAARIARRLRTVAAAEDPTTPRELGADLRLASTTYQDLLRELTFYTQSIRGPSSTPATGSANVPGTTAATSTPRIPEPDGKTYDLGQVSAGRFSIDGHTVRVEFTHRTPIRQRADGLYEVTLWDGRGGSAIALFPAPALDWFEDLPVRRTRNRHHLYGVIVASPTNAGFERGPRILATGTQARLHDRWVGPWLPSLPTPAEGVGP